MTAVPSLGRLEELCLGLSPRSSIVEASRVQMCLQARKLEESIPDALAGHHTGPLHDARVAGRRLRAGAGIFRSLYPGTWKMAERGGRAVTSGFRDARDLDIRAARLRRMAVDAKGRPPGSLALIRMLQEQTAARRTELAGHVRPLAEILPASLLAGLWRPRHTGVPAADRCVRVRLGELAQRVAMLIPVACVEGRGGVQHHLRIRCKALRYSLEMMEWRLGSEASWRLGTLRKIQDELGELHDIDVFWGYLEERSGQNAIRRPGRLRDLVRGLDQERHRRFEGFLDLREGLEKVLAPITF